jgi:VTC domain
MVMSIDTHARETRPFASEVKFLIDAVTGAEIRSWVRSHLDPDPYGTGPFGDEYRTTSLYFDTDEGDVFHRRGSFGRSKYRVRRYGAAPTVFLERKLRRPGILVKRRTTVPIGALARLAAEDDPAWAGAWFHRRLRLREINPVCQVSYSRMARTSPTAGGPVRLTLDDEVCVAPASEARFGPAAGVPILEGKMILELKYRRDLPAIFKRLIAQFLLAPQPASKYRLGVAALTDVGFSLVAPAASGDVTYV